MRARVRQNHLPQRTMIRLSHVEGASLLIMIFDYYVPNYDSVHGHILDKIK